MILHPLPTSPSRGRGLRHAASQLLCLILIRPADRLDDVLSAEFGVQRGHIVAEFGVEEPPAVDTSNKLGENHVIASLHENCFQ